MNDIVCFGIIFAGLIVYPEGRGQSNDEIGHKYFQVKYYKNMEALFMKDRSCSISREKTVDYHINMEELLDQERLKGAMAMAGGVCHELNQPLQIVAGFSELLLMDIPEDHPLYKTLTNIKEQIERMGIITKKLAGITTFETKQYGQGFIVDIEKASA